VRILVTAGGTREPIDRVRAITNTSTGATGAALAAALTALGHSVELLRSAHSLAPSPSLASQTFTTTASLEAALRERLGTGDIDAVLMAAAVADFRPAEPLLGKIDSEAAALTLRLVRVPKLLPQLHAMSPRPLRVIGFKLTVGASDAEQRDAVTAQFRAARVNAVVHNDLSEIETATARGTPHPFRLYTRAANDQAPPRLAGPAALAAAIHAFLTQPAK